MRSSSSADDIHRADRADHDDDGNHHDHHDDHEAAARDWGSGAAVRGVWSEPELGDGVAVHDVRGGEGGVPEHVVRCPARG
jgi:hypothetical protein